MPEWVYWQAMAGSMAGLLVFMLILALALVFVWMLNSDMGGGDPPDEDRWANDDTLDVFQAWREREEENDNGR